MSNPSALGSVCYESESSWAENVTTFTTLRIPTRNAIDPKTILHEKLDTMRTSQYRSDGSDKVLGCQGGTLVMQSPLCGHGSTTAGSVTITAYETFLGRIFGGTSAVSFAAGGTVTGGTANIPTISTSGTGVAGSLAFVGTRGDTDGEGQGFAFSGHSGNNLTLLTNLAGSPVNGALVGAPSMIFPTTSPTSTSITGTRFLVQSGNTHYRLHGCYPSAVSISGLSPGELPVIDHTWGISAWGYSTATFPSTVSTETANGAVVSSGSLWVNDVGTATHAGYRECLNFTVNYTLGVQPIDASGGVFQYQKTVAAVRTPDVIKLSWTERADANTLTPTLPGYGTGTTRKHVLYTCSTADGSRIAFYFPSVCIDNVATQGSTNGVNTFTIEATAYVGPTLTTELTRSPMRIAFG